MDQLIAMGFEETAVRNAWRVSNGNLDASLSILLQPGEANVVVATDNVAVSPQGVPTSQHKRDVMELDVSQYTFGPIGTSACTAVACIASAVLLKQFSSNITSPISKESMTQAIFSGVDQFRELIQIGQSEHIAADEFYSHCALFKDQINMVCETPLQVMVSPRALEDLIQQAKVIAIPGEYFALVLTKPPETVAILIPPDTPVVDAAAPATPQYVYFDSHTRPQLGICDGGHVITGSTLAPIVEHFHSIFPPQQLSGVFGAIEGSYNYMEATIFQLKK